ncbi:MAG TPA: hypothetical protein ENK67_03410 [Flavobacteriia bacterium]|jgi:hypothetical protein|nr:hypothetical protein [Flavobacteriia bacterium]
MKKITILFALVILVSTITVEANSTNQSNLKLGSYDRYHQRPVTFMERNVKFYIYLNGDLDFDLRSHQNGYYGASDYYYKGNRKSKSRKNKKSVKRYPNYGHGPSNFIQYDYYGRVKRIGNTFIHYDFYGRVVSVNRIRITYRHHLLSRVGNLKVLRNRYGQIRFIGSVKPRYQSTPWYYNDYYYDDYIYDYEDGFFYQNDFEDDYEYFEEDDDFYYYRSKNKHARTGKNGAKQMKQKMIKRRKPTKSKRKES